MAGVSVQILQGGALEMLRTLADESVQCIVSSPPYWRQRDYNMPEQLGLEPTPEEYIAKLTEIFREARRVLRDDGTCFINLGDKWASAWPCDRRNIIGQGALENGKRENRQSSLQNGLKEKDLIGLPFMLAFSMRADGWYWRQCNIWSKPNCMPESVVDRTTVSHEYVLHFSKSSSYFYDAEAVKTPPKESTETRLAQDVEAQAGSERANGGAKTNGPMKAVGGKQAGHSRRHDGFNARWDAKEVSAKVAAGNPRTTAGAAPGIDDLKHLDYGGANLRSVWTIPPAQYRDGHYAVMPDKLAEICILSGSRPGNMICDPFGGVGTTGLAADRYQRNAILIELNPAYAEMARKRIYGDSPLFAEVA